MRSTAPSSAFTSTLEIFTTQDSPSSGSRCTDRASRASISKDVMKKRGRCCDTVYTSLFIGDNNWPAIRAAITKVDYDGWLIPEMEARYSYAQDQQFYDTAADVDRLISGRL